MKFNASFTTGVTNSQQASILKPEKQLPQRSLIKAPVPGRAFLQDLVSPLPCRAGLLTNLLQDLDIRPTVGGVARLVMR